MAKHIRKPAPRIDRTRLPERKSAALTRKGQRIAKSARLFLCLAFPPQFAI